MSIRKPWLFRVRLLLLLLALAGAAWWGASPMVAAWFSGAEFDYGEGVMLQAAVQAAAGHSPYVWADTAYGLQGSAVYPPLFVLASAGLVRLVGPMLLALHLVTAFGILLACAGLYRMGARLNGWRQGTLTVLVFVGTGVTAELGSMGKPDGLALGLAVLGLSFATSRRWAATILFALALWTKPSMAMAPLAVLVWLLARHEWRGAAWFAVATAGLASVLHGLSVWWFGPDYLLMAFLIHLGVGTNLGNFHSVASSVLLRDGSVIVLAIIASVAAWRDERTRLYALYGVLSLLLWVTLTKSGANGYYLAEAAASWALLVGAMPFLETRGTLSDRLLNVLTVPCALWLFTLSASAIAAFHLTPETFARSQQCVQDEMLSRLANVTGPVLSDDAAWLVLDGRADQASEFFFLTHAAARLPQANAQWRADIAAERYAVVVLQGDLDTWRQADLRPPFVDDRFPPDVINLLHDHYRLAEHVEGCGPGRWVYRPAERPELALFTPWAG